MAEICFTKQAQSELDAIVEYYERVGATDFAEVFEEKVIEKIRPLEQFPRVGRMVPEIEDEAIREVIYRNYRIVYIVDRDDEEVEVLTIFHSSQQFGPLDSGGE
ncbi:MAG: type II toxin-antitoxin system RelE/ParE family toxin [Bacteroidetes bacterium QS_8_64_10]|nr:MAG: type II toxin-antitoxin system RelE/ParE family toxin [Bacteroidetes bacterium QS_8_64_10]